MEQFFLIYGIINGITFFIYGIDKLKAEAKAYRIPEKVLILLAFFGPIGGILGMQLFRHKTRKTKFRILVPTFLAIHIFMALFYTNVNASESPSAWAQDEYNEAVAKGFVTDSLKSNFQAPITRLEFVELIIKSYESVMGEIVNIEDEDNPFKDTRSIAAVKAYKMGIISGVSDTLFSPNTYINREQMIVIFCRMNRAIELRSEVSVLGYRDISLDFADIIQVSDWAKESFQIGVFNDLISGVGENQLGPKVLTSKEQAVVINLRLIKRYIANETLNVYVDTVNNNNNVSMKSETGMVTVEILNMRSTPNLSSSANIIRKLKLYEEVELLDKQGAWYHVYASGGLEGYVYTDYIRILDANTLQASSGNQSETATNIISYAKQFQGTRYLYAGTSLTKGIDCSGFTQQVMAPFGIKLSRSSAGQYSNGIAVSKAELKPGDLVYYGFSGRVSHVALYIGNQKVIHANTTYGVSITEAFTWLNKPVIGYRRVIL